MQQELCIIRSCWKKWLDVLVFTK